MNFFGLVNFGIPLSPEALCPLAEPLPPDSAGAAGVVTTGLTIELTACLLKGEGGLRRRKSHKKQMQEFRKVPAHTHLSLLPAEAALRFRVLVDLTAGSSAALSWTSDAVRLADGPTHNHHQSKIQQLNQTKEQGKGSQIHT